MLELLVDRVELCQPQGRDECADQAAARQVDAFAEGAAQDREADALPVYREPAQERPALGLVHVA
ncbi:hypothetical protein D3C87_2003280 [compost metagenome]